MKTSVKRITSSIFCTKAEVRFDWMSEYIRMSVYIQERQGGLLTKVDLLADWECHFLIRSAVQTDKVFKSYQTDGSPKISLIIGKPLVFIFVTEHTTFFKVPIFYLGVFSPSRNSGLWGKLFRWRTIREYILSQSGCDRFIWKVFSRS